MSVKDETKFGNNVWVTDSQTKEEREAKLKKYTLGNGKVVWTDNVIKLVEKDEPTVVAEPVTDDLPF